jgi:hypothetical protein
MKEGGFLEVAGGGKVRETRSIDLSSTASH